MNNTIKKNVEIIHCEFSALKFVSNNSLRDTITQVSVWSQSVLILFKLM